MTSLDPTQTILSRYAESQRVRSITKHLRKNRSARLQLKGIAGALESFFGTGCCGRDDPVPMIAIDKETKRTPFKLDPTPPPRSARLTTHQPA